MRRRARTRAAFGLGPRLGLGALAAALAVCFALAACEGDDTTIVVDGGLDAHGDATLDDDADDDDAAADALAPSPPWMILSASYPAKSEVAAFSVASRRVDGRLLYPGAAGRAWVDGADLWLLEEEADRVVKLDAKHPWIGGAAWSTKLDDAEDALATSSRPVAVVAGPTGKAYVLRYERNRVAVLDTTTIPQIDGGAPAGSIDLSPLLDPGDADGRVETTTAVFVAADARLYVVVGGYDRTKGSASPVGAAAACLASSPLLAAIDTTTDTLVSLGGAGPSGSVVLPGYRPIFGGLVYDAPRDRLLVIHAGCNDVDASDAAVGTVHRREVDAVLRGSFATSIALDLGAKATPTRVVRLDADTLALAFDTGAEARRWDLAAGPDAGLGTQLPNAPDVFAYDGAGNLLGAKTEVFTDGGAASSLVSVRVDDGGLTTLAPFPYSDDNGARPTAVEFWK